MIGIVPEAVVSCYIDGAAFLVMFLLLLLSERIRRRRSASLRTFFHLCLSVTVLCVLCLICHAMLKQPAPWCHTVAVAFRTLWELLILWVDALWVTYVFRKLYGEKKQRHSRYRLFFLPFAAVAVLLIVNLFTGIVFTYSAENRFEPKPLYFAITVIVLLYFGASVIIAQRYDKKSSKRRFMRVTPMLLSVGAAVIIQSFISYDIGVLGFVVGITLLYFSMVNEMHFVDEESGMYNRAYLGYLFDMALAGKSSISSAMILEVSGNLPACFEILREVLHKNGDVIRAESNKFLMFSRTASRSTMQYISSLVEEAENKYNEAHPDSKVQITERCRMRMADEDSFAFLRNVMDKKEVGDEMRGIVSMITELDRLDKELKLAADIQISMLPMKFPPFPDRKEFDLYASMTAAKEVGGDFYDFFLVDSDHLALVIADVSGKGIPAALFMTVSKTLIKNQLMSGCDPAAALERVNVQLCERNSSMMFVTAWVAVLEISTGKGLACNAGHENPGLRRAGEGFELLKYRHNVFLGANMRAKFTNREFELHPGDTVFVYTDGVPEATHDGSDLFGPERLTETLNLNPGADPEALIRSVRDAVDRFANETPQFDDTTMLCLKYYGPRDLENGV